MKIVLQLAAFVLLSSLAVAIMKLLMSAIALTVLGVVLFAWLGASLK